MTEDKSKREKIRAISNAEIIDIGGGVIIEKGKEYEVYKQFSKEFYGKGTGQFYPSKLMGYVCEGLCCSVDGFTEIEESET